MKFLARCSIILIFLNFSGDWAVQGEIDGNFEFNWNGYTWSDLITQCVKKSSTIQILGNAYKCFGAIKNSTLDSDSTLDSKPLDLVSFMDKFCNHQLETQQCLKPVSKLLKICSPFGPDLWSLVDIDLEGYFVAIVQLLQELVCVGENELSNGIFDALAQDSPAALNCMWNHMKVVSVDTVVCYMNKMNSLSPRGETKVKQQTCQNGEAFTQCFVESFEICNDKGAKRFVSNFMKMGMKKIFLRYLAKCNV